jgi:hypothetical protein
MSAERPYFIDDIVAAVRERRIGAETALAWLELRADEAAREARQVRAMWDRPAIRGVGEMSDQEADAMLPPRDATEFEARAQARDVRAAWLAKLSDNEAYDVNFPASYRERSWGRDGDDQ